MKKILLLGIAAAVLSGCGGETSFPTPTGQGNVRAINGIATSPEMAFRIEERPLSTMNYRNATPLSAWDDFDYTFNFEIIIPPGTDATRIASQFVDVVKDTQYTFLVWGPLSAPNVSVWEKPNRAFDENATVFELRIGHSAEAVGTVDVYFALDGVAPVLGEQIGTLAPGEISGPVDLEADDYVLTVTAAGDPQNILFQAEPTGIGALQSFLITVFEGTAADTWPVTASLYNDAALAIELVDRNSVSTVRYIHGTTAVPTADIYDDTGLTNRIVANLGFGEASADIPTAVGTVPITFTPAGNPGVVLHEATQTTFPGVRANFYLTGTTDALIGATLVLDRRPVETMGRLALFHSASNHGAVDLYVVPTGETIDEASPRMVNLPFGTLSPSLVLLEGDFDIYATPAGEKTILDGPVPLTSVLGGVYEGILLDRVDPALAEFRLIPPP